MNMGENETDIVPRMKNIGLFMDLGSREMPHAILPRVQMGKFSTQ
jgi:hypothetical protein